MICPITETSKQRWCPSLNLTRPQDGCPKTFLFSNGQNRLLGQIALASFKNASGLLKTGSSLYSESNNSGVAIIGEANSGGRGQIVPGTLEMSNVDLAKEFANMIIAQRGFQANSKIITASDEMLMDLVRLKG